MILHVDMDAFYAAVEQRDRPELRGKPVIVGGSPESRGVVSAASYEARKFGVHSAMPTAWAQRLCPHAVFLPARMQHYATIARQIREIFLSFTPLVEPTSLDEAFLDVRGCEGLFGPAPEIARTIKAQIRRETNLIASVGVAPNKFLAKLASDHGKPDGLVVIPPDEVADFLGPLPVGRIWGVGAKGERRLHTLGIRTVGQLAEMPEQVLTDNLGEVGRQLAQLARGQDDRPVVPDDQARSLSTETTFARDISERMVLRSWLLELTDHVAQRLREHRFRARTVELKIRSSDFRTHSRSHTLAEPTDLTDLIWQTAAELFDRRVSDDMLPARLLGVGVAGLVQDRVVQRRLYDEVARVKRRALDSASDDIRARFGSDAIQRGEVLARPEKDRQQEPS